MTCPNCGHSSRPGALFCGSCAFRLDGSIPGAAPSAPPPPPLPAPPALIPPPPAPGPPRLPAVGDPLLPPPPPASAPPLIIAPPPPFSQPRPTGAEASTPPRAPSPPTAQEDDEDDEDENDVTVVSDRRWSTGWTIVLADGTRQGVSGQVLVGRQVKNADPRWPSARLLSVVDTTKSVSKVHALVEADSAGFWVTDLGSTNGVIVATPGGAEIDLPSESRGEVPPGSSIILGNYSIRVEKS